MYHLDLTPSQLAFLIHHIGYSYACDMSVLYGGDDTFSDDDYDRIERDSYIKLQILNILNDCYSKKECFE